MKFSRTIALAQSDSLEFDFTNKEIKLNGSVIQMGSTNSVDLSFETYYCQLYLTSGGSSWRNLNIHCNTDFDTSMNYKTKITTSYGTSTGQIQLDTDEITTSYGSKIAFIIGTTDDRMELTLHHSDLNFCIDNDQGILIKFDHNGDKLLNLWYGLS